MAISHVQSANNLGAAISSLTITVAALTAGNVVVVAGQVNSEARTLTPSAAGVTWTTVVGPTDHPGGTTTRAYLWVGVVNTGGATSIVLTLDSSTASLRGWAAEFGGVATSSFTDQTAANNSGGTVTSGNIASAVTTTQADELLIAAFALSGTAGTITAGTNYTLVHSVATQLLLGEWRIVSATGSYDCPITWTTAREFVCVFATLKAAAGATFHPAWARGSNRFIGPGVLAC